MTDRTKRYPANAAHLPPVFRVEGAYRVVVPVDAEELERMRRARVRLRASTVSWPGLASGHPQREASDE